MNIFDSHAHLGHDVVFDVEVNEQDLLEVYAKNKVEGALIQPFICRPCVEDTRVIHNRIFDFIRQNPTYYGMISINPHLNHAKIETECQRCVRDLGFIGIKIATTAFGCPPDSMDGMHIFEIASELDIAVMIHTGGGSFGDPIRLIKPAEKFKNTNIIIAHAGGDDGFNLSIELAKRHDNIFLEPSWINILGIQKLLKTVGPDKFMYSSDMPQNVDTALFTFIKACDGNENDMEKVLYKTAKKVLNIDY